MKLLRVGQSGQEKVAAIDSEFKIRDLSSYIDDLNPDTINFKTLEKLKKIKIETLPEISKNTRVGPCINRPSNILCIGLNYSLHAEQTGSKLPDNPIVFNKSPDCLQGPNDPIKKNKSQDILKFAVKRMLPGGPLAKKQLSKLKMYYGDKHPHLTQNPVEIKFSTLNKKNSVKVL